MRLSFFAQFSVLYSPAVSSSGTEKVTVCGYAGSGAQELAERFGYKFEPITE